MLPSLELCRVRADGEFEVSLPPSIATPIWLLRILHLELLWNFWLLPRAPHLACASAFSDSVLPPCSHWCGPRSQAERSETYSLGLKPSSFPVLPVLEFRNLFFVDSFEFSALIGAPGAHCHLRTLSIGTEAN